MRAFGIMGLVAALTLAAAVVVPGDRAAADEQADIELLVRSAKTPADHERIAAYYDREAVIARAQAEKHRRMSEDYKKAGGPAAKTHLHEHCDALVKTYQSAAKDYESMAKAHREMAKAAK